MERIFDYDEISDNIRRIRETIKKAAPEREPILLAATKTVPAEVINRAIRNDGIRCIGENRVQELLEKYDALDLSETELHFIGKLQTNKVKYIIDKVDMIHSLDSLKLAAEIQRCAARIGKTMDVLVEINIGREENKSGILPEEAGAFFDALTPFDALRVRGIMTIAPKCAEKDAYRKYFRETYQIFIDILEKKQHNIIEPVLSMGMSDSFEAALAEGSTLVRIGSGIFGERAK